MKKIKVLLFAAVLFAGNIAAQTVAWTPLVSGTTSSLNGISAPTINTVYVCGAAGTIRKTTDGGTTWNGQISGTTQDLYYILFVDANTGYAVGNGLTALKTTNGGATWSAMTMPVTGVNFRHIFFIDSNTGFISGGGSGSTLSVILKTTDGGTTWTNTTVTGASAGIAIYGTYFTSSTDGYAVEFSGKIFKTTNGGSNWTTLVSGTTSPLQNLYFTGVNTGLVIGGNRTVRTTADAGTTWSGVTVSDTSTAFYSGIDFYDSNHGFVVGGDISLNTGTILTTTNGGASWTTSYPGTARLYRVDVVNANVGYASGLNGTILKYTSNVGIQEETTANVFTAYPNPFSETTTIDCSNYTFSNAQSVGLFDISGKLVKTAASKNRIFSLNRNGLDAGVYLYKVFDGTSVIGTGKLIIK
ncbi:MAG: YCF48-related protein [Bacteroidia bacterium]